MCLVRRFRFMSALGALMAFPVLASCSSFTPPAMTVDPVEWRKPMVEFSLAQQIVSFPEGGDLPGDGMAEDLRAFLQRQTEGGHRPVIRIYALDSVQGGGEDLDESTLARRQAVVADYVTALGFRSDLLPPRAGFMPHAIAGSVVVEAARYVAVPPPCPDWSGPPGVSRHNMPSSNLGCATARNLSLMVADPRDLVQGRRLGPAPAARLGKALRDYRQGQPLNVTKESTAQ